MPEFKRLINDDVLKVLPKLKDFSFHSILSDLPYNLSSNWYIAPDGSFQIKGKGSDFMGKWEALSGNDLDLMFKEFFRVLKYGGYCILFGLDNQIAPFQYYAVKHGFEVCQSLYYYYLSNMPKGTDVSKSIDRSLNLKRNVVGFDEKKFKKMAGHSYGDYQEYGFNKNSMTPEGACIITESNSNLAKKYDGYKYGKKSLKQVVEVIMTFRKPSKNGSIIDDIFEAEYNHDISPSVIDIENNRVGYTSDKDKESARFGTQTDITGNNYGTNRPSDGHVHAKDVLSSEVGRYPSNVFVSNDVSELLDIQSGVLKSGSGNGNAKIGGETNESTTPLRRGKLIPRNDSGGASRILHKCDQTNEDIIVITDENNNINLNIKQDRYPANVFISDQTSTILDAQSGILKSGKDKNPTDKSVSGFFGKKMKYYSKDANYGDSGGASRILHKCQYEEDDDINLFLYGKKVSPNERNAGLDNFKDVSGQRTTGDGFHGNKLRRCPEHGKSISSGANGYACGCSYVYDENSTGEPTPSKNPHPTLKPISLIFRLMKLFLLPESCNQKVLIPFSGVSSEIIGCVKAGIKLENITAIEINKEYCDIGKARFKYWTDKWELDNDTTTNK